MVYTRPSYFVSTKKHPKWLRIPWINWEAQKVDSFPAKSYVSEEFQWWNIMKFISSLNFCHRWVLAQYQDRDLASMRANSWCLKSVCVDLFPLGWLKARKKKNTWKEELGEKKILTKLGSLDFVTSTVGIKKNHSWLIWFNDMFLEDDEY